MSHNVGCVLESGNTGAKKRLSQFPNRCYFTFLYCKYDQSGKKYNHIQSSAINYFI